jgi:hypothetical protein
MKMLFFTMIFLSAPLFAHYETAMEEVFDPDQEYKFKTQDINKKSEKYKADEVLIFVPDKDLGVGGDTRFTLIDRNHFTIAYDFHHDFEKLNTIRSFELSYHRRANSYSKLWWGPHVYSTNANNVEIMGEPLPYTDNKNAEANIKREDTDKMEILGYGIGMGYRFKFLFDLWSKDNDFFEYVFAYLDKVTLFDEVTTKFYNGYGTTIDYHIQHRIRTQFYYGMKISYHLISVMRPAIGSEEQEERTINPSWTTFGLEIGYYF